MGRVSPERIKYSAVWIPQTPPVRVPNIPKNPTTNLLLCLDRFMLVFLDDLRLIRYIGKVRQVYHAGHRADPV